MMRSRLNLVLFNTLFLIALVVGGCATQQRKIYQPISLASAETAADSDFDIIDAHLHTSFTNKPNRFSQIVDGKNSLVSEMKANRVVGAVAHTELLEDGWQPLAEQHVIHCAGQGPTVNVAKLEAGLKSRHFRCVKIYLGYIAQYANDPKYEPAIKLAEKYHVPVVFHTGDTSERRAFVKYADPMLIDEVAVKHPKVTFVIAHLGNPWIETAAEIIYKNENVYGDMSAFLVGDLSSRTPEDMEEFVVKPIKWVYGYVEDPHKLMYGTDWPLANMKSYIWAVKRAIPKEHWRDVFYNNAQAVFHVMDEPKPVKSKL